MMRAVLRFASAAAAVALVVTAAGSPGSASQKDSGVPQKPDDRTIVHVLNRLGFGAAPGDVERVRADGLTHYIDSQLQPARIDDSAAVARLAAFATLSKSTAEMARDYYLPAQTIRRDVQRQQAAQEPAAPDQAMMAPGNGAAKQNNLREMMTPEQVEIVRKERDALGELMQAKILRAAYSERQLEEVLVDFWFNHFNVFSGKGQVRVYLNEYERDAIRPHVLGTFRELLQATAGSPAMLFYLDNWQSSAPDGAATSAMRRRNGRVNAQTPRRRGGLNENYARELMELHTLGVEGGYTQKDVQEVARAFTGWTIANPRLGGSFKFEPRMHDDGEKVVLGHRIKPGGGQKDGEQVLNLLASHPSTAKFIATKLARRFVADEPPPALVERAARRFRDTGGNIREVVRTIVTSPEFFAPEAYRAKIKTPFEFVVSAVRATGTEIASAMPLVAAVRNLGMPLYGCQPPTGYADKAEAWVNSGALLNRMNFALSLTSSQQSKRQRGGAGPRAMRGNVGAPSVASEALVASALAGELSGATAATVAKATTPSQALALVLGSPEFQRR
jgi:uncharacterized protein (DUF1800 family)